MTITLNKPEKSEYWSSVDPAQPYYAGWVQVPAEALQ